MSLKKLGMLLPRQLRSAGIERGVKAAYVLSLANSMLDEVFGEGTSSTYARAATFKCRKLQIATTNASLRQEIIFKQNHLIKVLNEKIGEDIVGVVQVII